MLIAFAFYFPSLYKKINTSKKIFSELTNTSVNDIDLYGSFHHKLQPIENLSLVNIFQKQMQIVNKITSD